MAAGSKSKVNSRDPLNTLAAAHFSPWRDRMAQPISCRPPQETLAPHAGRLILHPLELTSLRQRKLNHEVSWLDLCPRAKFIAGRVVLLPMNIGVPQWPGRGKVINLGGSFLLPARLCHHSSARKECRSATSSWRSVSHASNRRNGPPGLPFRECPIFIMLTRRPNGGRIAPSSVGKRGGCGKSTFRLTRSQIYRPNPMYKPLDPLALT